MCGTRTASIEGGHARRCPSCGAINHPRTDPVIIVVVVDPAGDRIVLGRQAVWPQGRYSALAGFVEPAEALERAVAREVLEESGVTVGDVRYHSSAWPSRLLMLGFHATWTGGEPRPVDGELEDALVRARRGRRGGPRRTLPGRNRTKAASCCRRRWRSPAP